MIHDKQRPIDGGGVQLRHIGTNSFGWDHHGTKTPNSVAVFSWFSGVRTIESSFERPDTWVSYGAGDGNRTHVRSLRSLELKSERD